MGVFTAVLLISSVAGAVFLWGALMVVAARGWLHDRKHPNYGKSGY